MPDVLADNNYTYTYGLGNLSQTDATGTEYFLGDALGSTRQLVNGSSEVGLAESYDPFGNPADIVGSDNSIFGYTGQQTDPSGLIYLRDRYYDPLAGRFLTQDTFSGYSDLPQTQNPYVYGLNNPILYTDPSGRSVQTPGFPAIGSQITDSITSLFQITGDGPCPLWDQLLASGGAQIIALMMKATIIWKSNASYWSNFVNGAENQWFDDITLGFYTKIAGVDLRHNQSPGYQEGRDLGHRIALIQAIAETAGGLIDLVIMLPSSAAMKAPRVVLGSAIHLSSL